MKTNETTRKTMEQIVNEKMFATYNDQTYELLYIGKTKFGYKAHLLRKNGDKFWVDPYKIEIVNSNGNGNGNGHSDSTHVTTEDVNLLLDCLYKNEQSIRKELSNVTMRSTKRETIRSRIASIKVLRAKLITLNEE